MFDMNKEYIIYFDGVCGLCNSFVKLLLKVDSDLKLFELLASKGYALGTDFIVGHPGETDELFLETYNYRVRIVSSSTLSKSWSYSARKCSERIAEEQ